MTKEKHRRYLKRYLCSRSSYMRQELCTGITMEHGKQPCNGKLKDPSERLVRAKVEMCKAVADETVVVLKDKET
jgi:hypothetical protein